MQPPKFGEAQPCRLRLTPDETSNHSCRTICGCRLREDYWHGSCGGTPLEGAMRFATLGGVMFAFAVIACSNSTTSPTTSTPTPSGSGTMPPATTATLKVMLKDGPFVGAKALLVTFSEISAHVSGGDFASLPFVGGASSRTCDLEKLTTAQDVLGTGPLPVGHYTQ